MGCVEVVPGLVEDTLGVAHAEVFGLESGGKQEPCNGEGCRPGTDDGDVGVLEALTDELHGVDGPCDLHGRRPLLVVVPYGDLAVRPELVEDVEALGVGDVLEVDTAEGGGEKPYGLDDLIGILGVEAYRDAIHASEVLE